MFRRETWLAVPYAAGTQWIPASSRHGPQRKRAPGSASPGLSVVVITAHKFDTSSAVDNVPPQPNNMSFFR